MSRLPNGKKNNWRRTLSSGPKFRKHGNCGASGKPASAWIYQLKGYADEYRIRIGNYRVRYEVLDQEMTVVVLHCAHRKEVYRQWAGRV
ncbi:MAG: type II toxin-antitoxin system RelE/ParE family toxin [Anaerolineae bacterium]|nr:type II toxin-antitoxin system RelE/ParE family toxin [Anaerolineae bacterium]